MNISVSHIVSTNGETKKKHKKRKSEFSLDDIAESFKPKKKKINDDEPISQETSDCSKKKKKKKRLSDENGNEDVLIEGILEEAKTNLEINNIDEKPHKKKKKRKSDTEVCENGEELHKKNNKDSKSKVLVTESFNKLLQNIKKKHLDLLNDTCNNSADDLSDLQETPLKKKHKLKISENIYSKKTRKIKEEQIDIPEDDFVSPEHTKKKKKKKKSKEKVEVTDSLPVNESFSEELTPKKHKKKKKHKEKETAEEHELNDSLVDLDSSISSKKHKKKKMADENVIDNINNIISFEDNDNISRKKNKKQIEMYTENVPAENGESKKHKKKNKHQNIDSLNEDASVEVENNENISPRKSKKNKKHKREVSDILATNEEVQLPKHDNIENNEEISPSKKHKKKKKHVMLDNENVNIKENADVENELPIINPDDIQVLSKNIKKSRSSSESSFNNSTEMNRSYLESKIDIEEHPVHFEAPKDDALLESPQRKKVAIKKNHLSSESDSSPSRKKIMEHALDNPVTYSASVMKVSTPVKQQNKKVKKELNTPCDSTTLKLERLSDDSNQSQNISYFNPDTSINDEFRLHEHSTFVDDEEIPELTLELREMIKKEKSFQKGVHYNVQDVLNDYKINQEELDHIVDIVENNLQEKENNNAVYKSLLENFTVDIPFDIPETHKIETKISGSCTAKQNEAFKALGVTMKTLKYTKEEDEIILTNWTHFCKHNDWDVKKPMPFMNMKISPNQYLLKQRERINFVRFLGNNLPLRKLSSVYNRFVRLFKELPVMGKFTPEEDKIILSYVDTGSTSVFAELEKVLRRPKISIQKRYITLKEHKKCPIDDTKYDRQNLARNPKYIMHFLDALMKVMQVEKVSDLESMEISREQYVELGVEIKEHGEYVRKFWSGTLYPKIFVPKKITLQEVKLKIVHFLKSLNPTDWKTVDWDLVASEVPGTTRVFCYKNFYFLVKANVPTRMRKNIRECLSYLEDKHITNNGGQSFTKIVYDNNILEIFSRETDRLLKSAEKKN